MKKRPHLRTKIARQKKGTRAGREIIDALTELAEVLESGLPLDSRFTVRTATLKTAATRAANALDSIGHGQENRES